MFKGSTSLIKCYLFFKYLTSILYRNVNILMHWTLCDFCKRTKKVHHAATEAEAVETLWGWGGGVRGGRCLLCNIRCLQLISRYEGADMSGLPGKFWDSACFYWLQHNSVYHCSYLPQTQIAHCVKTPIKLPLSLTIYEEPPVYCVFTVSWQLWYNVSGSLPVSSAEGVFIATLSYTWYLGVILLCRQFWLWGYNIFIFSIKLCSYSRALSMWCQKFIVLTSSLAKSFEMTSIKCKTGLL